MRPDASSDTTAGLIRDLAWHAAPAGCTIPSDEVHLWRVTTPPTGRGVPHAAWAVLGDAERQRALCYRDERAARGYAVVRARLRTILAGYLGCAPADVDLEQQRNGRPFIRSRERPCLRFSVSRTAGIALIAVADGGAVGVDIERVPSIDAGGSLPWRCIHEHAPPGLVGVEKRDDDPAAFCVAWTRLEAYAKAFTGGLRADRDPPLARNEMRWRQVRSFSIPGGYVASLAEDGRQPRRLVAFDTQPAAVAP